MIEDKVATVSTCVESHFWEGIKEKGVVVVLACMMWATQGNLSTAWD